MNRRLKTIWFLFLFLGAQSLMTGEESKPEPKFRFVFFERIRQESSDNVTSLDENAAASSAYIRFKTSFSGQWKPKENLELFLRMTNENRYYITPKTDLRLKKNYDFHEIFFDQLYVKWKNAWHRPLTLTFGRQDIVFGEGFIIQEGAPLDGSRSFYFNALRLDYTFRNESNLTFFYIYQQKEDTLLPVINNWHQKMNEQNEQALGLYYKTHWRKNSIETYLLRKDAFAGAPLPHLGYFCLGGRVNLPLLRRLNLTAEAAGQFGRYADLTHRAWGGYFHLDSPINGRFPVPAQWTVGGIYLNGDRATTGGIHESWDPAFGRWPKWSESFIYFLGKESRIAYWSDFVSLYGGLVFSPAEKVTLSTTLHQLYAAQPAAASSLHSGQGRNRGLLWVNKFYYEISDHLSGHLVLDTFSPGSYYVPTANAYLWIRFELSGRW